MTESEGPEPEGPEPVERLPRPALATARLVVLALVLVAWLMPWAHARPDPLRPARVESGALRTGAVFALAFVAAWGLAASSRLARTRAGLVRGEAATSLAIAGAVALFLAIEHPWIPGGERRVSWLPIFGPLALLALLDLVVQLRRGGAGPEVTAIRAGSAAVAGLALVVAKQPLPAAAALWLCGAGFSSLLPQTGLGTRRFQDALSLAAAAALLLAPEAFAAVAAPAPEIRPASPAPVAYRALAAMLGAFTVVEVLRRPAIDAPR